MKEQDQEMRFTDEDLLVLQGDDGKEIEFIHVATIDYKDEWYAFLQPVEMEGVGEDEIIILKIVSDEEGNDTFETVEDEDLLQEVYEEYVKECIGECDCDCEDCDSECDGECNHDHKHECHCDDCKKK